MEHVNVHLINDRGKHDIIEKGRRIRNQILEAIQYGQPEKIDELLKQAKPILLEDTMDIFKRIPNDFIRSYKNHLITMNSLSAYCAEKGGLPAWKGHYLSEKYAILIESTNTLDQLKQIESTMLVEYSMCNVKTKEKDTNTSIVQKAEEYIMLNYDKDFTIEEMALELHVNPSHLMRSFKREKGMTISQYRNQRRIKEAKEFLIFTDVLITDISTIVGFSNPQYFSKMFKKIEGISPNEFRIHMRNEPLQK